MDFSHCPEWPEIVRKVLDEPFPIGYVGFLKEVFTRLHMKGYLFSRFRRGEKFARDVYHRPEECSKFEMFGFLFST